MVRVEPLGYLRLSKLHLYSAKCFNCITLHALTVQRLIRKRLPGGLPGGLLGGLPGPLSVPPCALTALLCRRLGRWTAAGQTAE